MKSPPHVVCDGLNYAASRKEEALEYKHSRTLPLDGREVK